MNKFANTVKENLFSLINEMAQNYESYNDFAHIEQRDWKYLIRVKDPNSNGILSAFERRV